MKVILSPTSPKYPNKIKLQYKACKKVNRFKFGVFFCLFRVFFVGFWCGGGCCLFLCFLVFLFCVGWVVLFCFFPPSLQAYYYFGASGLGRELGGFSDH